jgi:hypothetical protein
MKMLLVIMIAVLVPSFIIAQDTPLSSLYDKYSGEPGFKTSEIMPGSMSFAWEAEAEHPEVKEMMKDIEKIRLIRYNAENSQASQEKIWKKIQKSASDEQYIEVMTINADDVQARLLMIRGTSGNTREVALVERDKNGIMLITVTGNMNFSEMFSAENMQNIRKMAEHFIHEKGGCSNEDK